MTHLSRHAPPPRVATTAPGCDMAGGGFSKLRVLDLFSGIGGFSLGLERTGGFETAAFCEIEPFPRKVLAKHWPGVPCYDDVRTLTGARLAADGITGINVITGGFPCQDISTAGKRAGIVDGSRSGLWSEIIRLIGDLSPSYVIVENVANLLAGPSEKRGGWFGRVLGDLAECGYNAEWENIPASALGAPHRRERVWLVAYPAQDNDAEFTRIHSSREDRQLGDCGSDVAHAHGIHAQGQQPCITDAQEWERPLQRPPRPLLASIGGVWKTEPALGRVANGVPDRSHRLAALGNAVVPQIPELIGHAILNSRTSGHPRRPVGGSVANPSPLLSSSGGEGINSAWCRIGDNAATNRNFGFVLDPQTPGAAGATGSTPGAPFACAVGSPPLP